MKSLGLPHLLVCSVVLLGCVHEQEKLSANPTTEVDWSAPDRDYDWKEAEAKLKRIGQAIQLYRAQHKPKPVRDRKSYADTGLPSRAEGWGSLGVAKEDWFVKTRMSAAPVKRFSDFTFVCEAVNRFFGDAQSDVWSKRGEDVPIIVDKNMYSFDELRAATKEKRRVDILILRLGGKVERARVQLDDYVDLMLNR